MRKPWLKVFDVYQVSAMARIVRSRIDKIATMAAALSISAAIAPDVSAMAGARPEIFEGRICITRPETAQSSYCRPDAVLEMTIARHHLTDRDVPQQADGTPSSANAGVRQEPGVRCGSRE